MAVTTVKTTIRQVYQYLNDRKELCNRALVFGVRYPGLIFGDILAANLGNLTYLPASVAKMRMDSLLVTLMLDTNLT